VRIAVGRDLGAGIMFLAFGAFFALAAGDYSIGTAARMGPGFFPLAVGALIAAFGLILLVRSLAARAAERADLVPGPLAVLVAGLCLFAVLVADIGLAVAIPVLAMVSARAGAEFRWREAAVLSIALAVFSIAAFVYVLGLPLRVWPAA
jgi:hypothetical protein